MNDDELRHRLRALDPVPDDALVEPSTSPSARARLEHIMNSDTRIDHGTPSEPDGARATPQRPRPRWPLLAAAAVVLVVGMVAALTVGGDDDADVVSGPPLELSLGASDAMASCLPADAQILAGMPLAFGGTATAVDDEMVTLEVERWYAGGDAAEVELRSGDAHPALIAGFEFEVGRGYLVSASEGTVNFCGFSGPATPELTDLFEEAFGE